MSAMLRSSCSSRSTTASESSLRSACGHRRRRPAQASVRIVTVSGLQRRHDDAELGTGKHQAFGNFMGGVDGLWTDGKPADVFVRRGQPGIGRGNIVGRQARKRGVAVNGPQQPVDGPIFRVQKKTSRCRHQGDSQVFGGTAQLMGGGQGVTRHGSGHGHPGRVPGAQQVGSWVNTTRPGAWSGRTVSRSKSSSMWRRVSRRQRLR